jgi:cell division protein FtsB
MDTPADPNAPAETPKIEAASTEAPKIEAPKFEAPKVEAPKIEIPKIEAEAHKADEPDKQASKISYLQPFTARADHHETIDKPSQPRSRHTLMAASIALVAVFGGLAGAATIIAMRSDKPAPETTAAIQTNEALRASVTRLEGEIATLRSGIATAQRSTGSQLGKLTERIDRADKAQAEPTAKLAKLTETIERLEKRLPQPQQAAAQTAQPEVTGSVAKQEAKPEPKVEAKPQIAEGWRLLDVYGGRAIVENRNGRAFEIMQGSNLPGLGRVDTIKRENGRVTVVTKNGIITAATEPRRRSRYYDDD